PRHGPGPARSGAGSIPTGQAHARHAAAASAPPSSPPSDLLPTTTRRPPAGFSAPLLVPTQRERAQPVPGEPDARERDDHGGHHGIPGGEVDGLVDRRAD